MARNPFFLLGLVAASLLSACGGGGGGSAGGSSGGGGSGLDVTFSLTSVTFTVHQYDTVGPAAQVITATARGGRAYLRVSGYPATLNCAGSTSSCTIAVFASPPAGRPIGSTTDLLFVDVCADEFCGTVIRTREIPVIYRVMAGIGLTSTPAAASLSAQPGDASASTSLAFTFTNGTPTTWSAEVVYPAGNGGGWLTATPSGDSLLLTATPLEPETWSADLRITYGSANWSNTVTIPVTYVVRSPPSVEFVSPYIAYTNDPRPVIVRGKGFDAMTHPIRFGGVAATDVVQVSPTELHVTPPAFATPGTHEVSIANDSGFTTSTGKYVVLAPHSWPYTAVTLPVTTSYFLDRQVYFDAERQAAYYTLSTNAIHRVRYVAGAWSVDDLPLATVMHYDVSPDGRRLYAVNSGLGSPRQISELDLDTLAITRTYPFTTDLTDLRILNTGQALIHSLNTSARYTFPLERLSHQRRLGGFSQSSVVSPDRRRVIVTTEGTGAGNWIHDEPTGEFRELPESNQFGSWQVSTDRGGTRIVARNEVYDASGALLGVLQDINGYSGVAVNPEGTRAYVVVSRSDLDTSTLRIYDISGATGPYAQAGSNIALPHYLGDAPSPIRISNDGRHLFIFGSVRFVVMPVP